MKNKLTPAQEERFENMMMDISKHPYDEDAIVETAKQHLAKELSLQKKEIWKKDKHNASKFRHHLNSLIWAIKKKKEVNLKHYVDQAIKAIQGTSVKRKKRGGKK